MTELADDNKTIFSGDLDFEERSALASGEARGKLEAMRENPKRFSLARQRGSGRKYEKEYVRIFGHD